MGLKKMRLELGDMRIAGLPSLGSCLSVPVCLLKQKDIEPCPGVPPSRPCQCLEYIGDLQKVREGEMGRISEKLQVFTTRAGECLWWQEGEYSPSLNRNGGRASPFCSCLSVLSFQQHLLQVKVGRKIEGRGKCLKTHPSSRNLPTFHVLSI